MNTDKKLTLWVREGLLSSAQAKAIRDFEARPGGKNWVLLGVGAIGVTAIATGVVSVVAANWDRIPVTMKLFNYFLWQVLFGLAFVKVSEKEGPLRESFLTLFALLFLGGIGLVAQIYNLRSDGWQGILFWCALACPAVLLARSRLLPELWFAGLTAATLLWMNSRVYLDVQMPWLDRELVAVFVAFTVAAVSLARYDKVALPSPFRRAGLQWGIGASVGAVSLLASLLWYGIPARYYVTPPFWLLLFPTVGVGLVAAVLATSRPAYEKKIAASLSFLFLAQLLYLAIPLLLPIGSQKVAGCAGFLIVWSLAATSAVAGRQKRLFDLATFVMAARLVVVYFEVFGSLAATGVGLIVSGGLILGAAYGWHRFRGRLGTWLGRTL